MKNKVVFISGASRGIGQSLANYFAEKDYYVVGTSRNDFKFKKDDTPEAVSRIVDGFTSIMDEPRTTKK